MRIELEKRVKPAVHFSRLIPAAGSGQVPEMLILAREGDAGTGDPAVDAEYRRFQDQIVDADEYGQSIAHFDADFGDSPRVGGAFLDGDQVGDIRQLA